MSVVYSFGVWVGTYLFDFHGEWHISIEIRDISVYFI